MPLPVDEYRLTLSPARNGIGPTRRVVIVDDVIWRPVSRWRVVITPASSTPRCAAARAPDRAAQSVRSSPKPDRLQAARPRATPNTPIGMPQPWKHLRRPHPCDSSAPRAPWREIADSIARSMNRSRCHSSCVKSKAAWQNQSLPNCSSKPCKRLGLCSETEVRLSSISC